MWPFGTFNLMSRQAKFELELTNVDELKEKRYSRLGHKAGHGWTKLVDGYIYIYIYIYIYMVDIWQTHDISIHLPQDAGTI